MNQQVTNTEMALELSKPVESASKKRFFADQLRGSLLVARRELRDGLADWRIVTPIAVLTFIFPWLIIYSTKAGIGFVQRQDPGLVLTQLIPFAAMIVGFFPISFSLVIALESFVGEKERNTLESLLSTPATDTALYIGKLIAALALPLTGSITAILLYTLGLPWVTGRHVPLDLLGQILFLTVTLALGMVAGAVVVSSNTTSVRAANLLASFIVMPATLLIGFQAIVIVQDKRGVLWYIGIAQALADLALVRMGIRLFNCENLLARTVDRIDLRRTSRAFWGFIAQEPDALRERRPSLPFSVGRVYRHDLPQIMRRIGGAVVVVVLLIAGAFGIGWLYAQAMPFPPERAEELNLTPDKIKLNLENVSQVMGIDPFVIVTQNVRGLVLGAVGGTISFGAAAVAPLFLTFGLLGFLAGQASGLGLNLAHLSLLIIPHGILEIPAAIIAAATGLRMGASLMSPPRDFTLGETLLLGLADFVKVLFFLVIPLLLAAAFVEVYLTPRVVMWLVR